MQWEQKKHSFYYQLLFKKLMQIDGFERADVAGGYFREEILQELYKGDRLLKKDMECPLE